MQFSIIYQLSMVVFLIHLNLSDGKIRYGCCAKFRKDEPKYPKAGYDRFCLKGPGGEEYCKEWECPCGLIVPRGECAKCGYGKCQNGGRVFKYGDTFLSVDGINRCSCHKNGASACTKIGTNYKNMCTNEKSCIGFVYIPSKGN